MSRNLYALLVGINAYPPGVNPLRGCVPDVHAVEAYLQTLKSQDYQPHILKLLDGQATRQGVIESFRSHLRDQASKDDVVLFYYSGHGSHEPCPAEWLHLEPDGRIESLVCYDSRLPGGSDLADKELGQLVREISASRAHVLVILDACHSGSGTRDAQPEEGVRLLDGRRQPRTLEQFLPELGELSRQDGFVSPASGWLMTPSPHILLAACEDRQTARERPHEGQWHGLFTRFLLETLQNVNRRLTYQELLAHVRALTLTAEPDQTPQLESFGDSPDSLFLNGAVQPAPAAFQVQHHRRNGWTVAGGALHGLQSPAMGQHTQLLIFPFEVDLRTATAAQALATAAVTEVKSAESRIKLAAHIRLDPNQVYQALVIGLPLPVMDVCFEGDEDGLSLARQSLATSGASGQPSLYVRENPFATAYRLLAKEGRYSVTHPNSPRPVTATLQGYTPTNAGLAIFHLEHIARWQQLLDLRNPNSRIERDAVRVYLTIDGRRVDDPSTIAEYYFQDSKWMEPEMTLTVENLTDRELYCAVLGLQENFAVTSDYFETASVRLPPGGSQTTSKRRYLCVPKESHQQGVTENRNIYKVIVSSIDLQPKALEQDELRQEINREVKQRLTMPKTSLGRLFETLSTRGDSERRESDEEIEDWTARQVMVTVRRPLQDQPITAGRSIELSAGVQIRPHASLQARARLVSAPQSARALDAPPLPRALEGSVPLYFQPSRGNDPGLSVLELTDVQDFQAVTTAAPLEIQYPPELLQPGEHALALAYDSELDCYLPLGYDSQPGLLQLQRLPVPGNAETKTPLGSLKIYFQKLMGKPLGLYHYPRLRLVEVDGQGDCKYIEGHAKIKKRVAAARQITLYIHGFFGETETMVFSAPLTNPDALHLAYDYENINTPVEQVAADLRDCLAKIGLDEQHIGSSKEKKNLRIVAHSLGGLVSRYFIERLGGNKLVSHLVILGTPNAGTPLAVYEDQAVKILRYKGWGEIILTLGITVAWPLATLGQIIWWLAEGFDKAAVNLDRLNPSSDFIQDLKRSTDPGVRYTLVAGDTTNLWDDPTQNKIRRLLARVKYETLDLLYLNKPNDIAVTVESIHTVAWLPKSEKLIIPCDHEQYFTSKIGQETQRKALSGGKA